MVANRSVRRAAAAQGVTTPMANARGELTVDLGYRKLKLKLTLGAIADCEDEFEVGFNELETALTSTTNIAKLIAFMARAAGEDVPDEEIEQIRRAPVEIKELMLQLKAVMGIVDEGPQPQAAAPSA